MCDNTNLKVHTNMDSIQERKINLIERDHPLRRDSLPRLSLQLYQMKFQEPKPDKTQSANSKKKPKVMKQTRTSSENPTNNTYISF
jgi:hypothetical protein